MILASLLLALSGGVTVQLPEKVDCQGVNLRLGDVARVSSEDEALLEKVKELELGYMPAPSFSRLLHRAQLQAALAKEFPDVTFKFAGVDRTRVYPKTQVVSGTTIEAAAKAVVEKRFAGQDVDLALRDHLNDLTVPLGRESLEVKARPGRSQIGLQSQGVAVDILIDGELWRTQWTSWSIVTWQEVPVLTMPVAKGNKLTPAMFRVERRRQALSSASAPLKPNQVIEAQAIRDLIPGEPVYSKDVERIKVIVKGNLVSVEIHAGGVTARSRGVAQEDGRIGDTIRVKLESTDKELVSTVVGRNRTEIRLR